MATSATKTRAWLRSLGFEVLTLPLALFAIVSFWIYESSTTAGVAEQIRQEQTEALRRDAGLLTAGFARSLALLEAAAGVLAEHHHDSAVVRSALESLLQADDSAFQARLLSLDGQELFRIDRVPSGFHWVPAAELQDKSLRDYVIDMQSLIPGDLYTSPIDLNIERGVIEVPYRPTERIGMRLADDIGLLIVNLDLSGVVSGVTANNSDLMATWILNQNGDWLLGPDPELEWGFVLGERHTVYEYFPESAEQIMSRVVTSMVRDDHSMLLSYRYGESPLSRSGVVSQPAVLKTIVMLREFAPAYLDQRVFTPSRHRQYAFSAGVTALAFALFFSIGAWRRAAAERTRFELRNQEADRLHGLANLLPQLTFTCNREGLCDFVSESWGVYTGAPAEELIGTGWFEFVHPEDQDNLSETWGQSVRSGDDFFCHFRIRREDGVYRMFDTRARAMKDSLGNVLTWFGSNTDVQDAIDLRDHLEDERLRLARELEDSYSDNRAMHERLEMAATAARLGAWEVDAKTGHVEWDERVYQMFNRDPQQGPIDGDEVRRQVHPEDVDAFTAAYDALFTDGKTMDVEYRLSRPGRSDVWVHALGTTRTDADGNILSYVGCCLDISDLKRNEMALREARDQAETANRAKSSFLANMSHEIRTPMNGVLGMLSLLRDSGLEPEKQEYIDKAYGASERLLAILNDILDLSRIESGNFSLDLHPFEPEQVIRDGVEVFAVSAEQKSVDLTIYVEPGMPLQLIGDPLRISQVISNIVGNAIKFTPAGGLVSVEFRLRQGNADNGEFEVAIRDNGVGMTAEQLGRVFEAFAQADNSTTRRFGGTGLGLSICDRLVRSMKGRIEVESEPGIGSVFTVCIPVTRVQPGADADVRNLGGLQLILVTPDKPLGDMVNMYLAPVGAMVAVFRSVDDPSLAAALSDGNGANTIVFFDAVHAPADRSRRPLDDFRQLLGMRSAQSRMAVYAPSRLQARDRIDFAAANVAIFSVPLTQSRLREGLATMLGMQPPSEAQTPAAVADANLQTLAGLRVLSVDDVAMNNDVIAGMLTRLGVEAECVSSAYQALDRLAAGHYDVVLMDVHMDTMNGLEATRRIRAMDIEQPLIFGVSASVMEEDQRAGLESGMDAYLMKPFRLKDFVAAMAKQGFGNVGEPETTGAAAVAGESSVTLELPLFIDIDDLRERLVDEALMRNSLSTFVRVYEKGADELEAALKGDDTELAIKLVHRLKGAARSIADSPIDRCAAEIEQRLKQGERRDEDVELADLLRQHITALKPALAGPASGQQLPDDAFTELLTDLRARYEASRFVPAETIDSLIDGLRERGLAEQADEIRTHVDSFEIDVVPELLARVAERLS